MILYSMCQTCSLLIKVLTMSEDNSPDIDQDIENLKELLTNDYSGDKSKLITSRCKREKTTEPVRY